MEETNLLKILAEFANGNTLIILYCVVSFIRLVVKPVYRHGKDILEFVRTATRALQSGALNHQGAISERTVHMAAAIDSIKSDVSAILDKM